MQKNKGRPLDPWSFTFSTEKMCLRFPTFSFPGCATNPIVFHRNSSRPPFQKNQGKELVMTIAAFMELAFDKQVLKQRVKDRSTTYL